MADIRVAVLCSAWLLLTNCRLVHTTFTDDVEKLHTELLDGYNKHVRPAENNTSPAVIYCAFYLVSVLKFDEVEMELSINGFLNALWEDPRLTWNASDHNGMESVLLPLSRVWVPPLKVTNPTEVGDPLPQSWMYVRHHQNGMAEWAAGDVFNTICSVDVTHYPFDTQVCEIRVVPLNHKPPEVQLKVYAPKIIKSFYEENGEWEFSDSDVATYDIEDTASILVAYIYMKRRPTFVMVNVILPILFMAFLNILVFALPAESGERVSYSITVLLAVAVFLTLVGDNIPKTSRPMSLLGYFLMTELCLSVLICVATILNLRLFYKSESAKVPSCLKTITRAFNCASCKRRGKSRNGQQGANYRQRLRTGLSDHNNKRYHDDSDGPGGQPSYPPPDYNMPWTSNAKHQPNGHVPFHPGQEHRNLRHHRVEPDGCQHSTQSYSYVEDNGGIPNEGDDDITWQDVSRMVDKVLALFCCIYVISATVTFYCTVVDS